MTHGLLLVMAAAEPEASQSRDTTRAVETAEATSEAVASCQLFKIAFQPSWGGI